MYWKQNSVCHRVVQIDAQDEGLFPWRSEYPLSKHVYWLEPTEYLPAGLHRHMHESCLLHKTYGLF